MLRRTLEALLAMLAKVKIVAKFETLEGLTRRVRRGLAGAAFLLIARAAKKTAREEFILGAFAKRDGGWLKWKPRHPLSKTKGPPLGGVEGQLFKSWRLRPTGKFRVVFASSHPGAAVHRGSARGGPGEIETRILPKKFSPTGRPLMWGALFSKGIIVSPGRLAKRGVIVPSRPHLGPSLILRQRINKDLQRYFLTGR